MKRAELLTVIMHDIGLPIVESVIQVALNQPEEKVIEDVTRLLRQTIDNADDIRGLLDLIEEEEKDVSVRLNLATLSCHIIAAHYKRTGSLPTQAELKRTVSSVDQLLTFSENYIPMDRLEGVFPENIRGLSPLSRTVANLVYLKYYVPLVDAVAEFSFGMAEDKMIQKVSEELRNKATEITHNLMGPTLPVAEQKSSELLILSSLIPLYCSCHSHENGRIQALEEDEAQKENSKTQIENIWLLFDKRLSMLSVMAKHIMPDHFSDEAIGEIENLFTDGSGLVDVASAPDKSPAKTGAKAETKTETFSPVSPMAAHVQTKESPEKAASPVAVSAQTAPSMPGNPMGFFTQPEPEENHGTAQSNETSAPPKKQPEEKGDEDGDKDSGSSSKGGNGTPMSFFTGT